MTNKNTMERDQNRYGSNKATEVRLKGLEQLDGLTGRVVLAGLIAWSALRHPLTTSLFYKDEAKRTVAVVHVKGEKND